MAEETQKLPFEDQMKTMPLAELEALLTNWFYEVPPCYAATDEDAARVVKIVEARSDHAEAGAVLALCRAYSDAEKSAAKGALRPGAPVGPAISL